MTQENFDTLSKTDKDNIVLKVGVFLFVKTIEDEKYAVYAIDKFFAEMKYKIDTLEALEINSFIEGRLLDRYTKMDYTI